MPVIWCSITSNAICARAQSLDSAYKNPNNKLACHSQAHDYSKKQDSRLGSQGDSSSTCSSVLQYNGPLKLALSDAFQRQGCLLACQWAALVQLLSDHNNGHPQRMAC